ncbi:PR domain zinc finger protein 2 [Puntigrus tetrazona]|uniref:PR domain zinc finger protein 2 n=1 Tax=Puntigrus tetrazona TaxID=1606681 RepID=UPI001C8ABA1B|nr:PR domain zinc finger protein 2 [Puntigrus tetrazona]XP_043107989.1 PR domain zinc finger protein 2 [Puntigrus tetrazona]
MAVPQGTYETLDDIPAHVWKGLPNSMKLGPSAVNPSRIGVWASRLIPKGKRFGPFVGERKKRSQVTSNVYMWEVYFPAWGWMCIDATDPMKGNWLRYVNWARSSQEQNLFPLEINRAIYYKVLRPIGPDEELLVWYNGEDNPEIAAALEEERTSNLNKKSSPRAKRARRKLSEKARQADLGGFCEPNKSSAVEPLITEMRDSEEGLNGEERPSSPSELQQENAAQSSSAENENLVQSHITEINQREGLDEENAEVDGQLQQPELNQSPQHPSEAESVDGNEKSLLPLHSGSPADESTESPLCDTECISSLANPELEAEGDFEDDPQGGTYPCQHCERHFSTKQGLERHTHIHTTSNHQTHTFKCRYCAKPFGSQVGRRRHERRHENGSKTLNRPGSLSGTAFLHSPTAPNDSATSGSASSPSHSLVMNAQNGPLQQTSDSLKTEPGAESDRPFILDENGESKELHPCKYCNKAFGTHTNMRRHQRRIHERHLMPKGVRRKGMLLQDGSSQQQQQHEQGQSVLLQEESPSASPPPIYVPSVETEDEGEREECMVDISNNISENLSHYIDGKIPSTSTVSNCEVIEVDSSTAALFGLDALILSPKQISHAFKIETRTCPTKEVSCVAQTTSKRRTATPPLLPAVKMETETVSSSSSLSSPSSQSSLLVGNIFSQSTETLAFQKEKSVYLSPKLKQLLQAPDGQKPAIGLIPDSHRLTTPLSVTSLPAVQGKFKRRTASPPTTSQCSPAQKNDNISSATGVSCSLKVPKIESHCMTHSWSLSSKDHGDAVSLTGKDWSPSSSGGNSCNQQPLDLSNSFSKKDNSVSKGSGEAVLDLSVNRKSPVDHEGKTSSATLTPHVKRKKPNTSILEKVLMNEYAGLNSPGDEGCNALGSPDVLSSSESATCVGPSSPGSGSERLPCESASPPSLTPMTINPSSPSSSSIASSTPPPPVLPTIPSPPPLSSSHFRMSDASSPAPFPVLSPKMSPRAGESLEEVSDSCALTEACHDTFNSILNESDQTAEQLDPAISPLPQDAKRHCTADSASKSETLLEGSTLDSQFLRNADQAGSSHLEWDTASKTSQSHSCEGTLPQDLNNKTEGRHKSKSSLSKVQSTLKKEPSSPSFLSELDCSQKSSVVDDNSFVEDTGKSEGPVDITTNGGNTSPRTTPRSSDEVETLERETFVKSFVCNVCKEPFRSIKDLSGHIIEHASEWPFKCEFCVQLFGNATALLEHRSSLHGVGRIYICSICSKEFAFLCNLQQHQSDLHPSQSCTHTAVENGKLRPQNYTDPAYANVEKDTVLDSIAGATSENSTEERNSDTTKVEEEENGNEDPTEELYTTIKIMASEAGKPKGPDVRLGINQHYPSYKPPPFPYHNRTPDGSVASATNFTTHNIPQTFSTAIRCTKCGNSFDNMPELHKHILVCANASDKRRYTPKKNPIPLKQVVKQSPNGLLTTTGASAATAAAAGQNAFRRMGQPKRLNFNQDITSKAKLSALNKKKNQLVQKAISQKNKSVASIKKPTTRVKEEETHKAHACPYCSREFTYPASLSKHIACSCPQRPVAKKLKKGALMPQDKNRSLRSRATDYEVKQEPGSGPTAKPLGKTRARSSEPVESEAPPANKGKAPQVRTKRLASNADTMAPQTKKGRKSNEPLTSITPALTDDSSTLPPSKMQRSKEVVIKKELVIKKESVVKLTPSKKEERFSTRARERKGGPVTRSVQMASASAPLEVKSEDLSNHEPGQSEESLLKLAR